MKFAVHYRANFDENSRLSDMLWNEKFWNVITPTFRTYESVPDLEN